MKKKHLIMVVKVLLAGSLIYWLVRGGYIDFSGLKLLLQPLVFSTLLVLMGLNLFLVSERWRILVKSEVSPLSSSRCFCLTLIGNFFNYFLPGGVGGDVVKAYYAAREFAASKTRSILTVLMDRVLGLYSMMIISLVALLSHWSFVASDLRVRSIFYLLVSFFLATTLGILFIFTSVFSRIRWIKGIFQGLNSFPLAMKFYEGLENYGSGGKLFSLVVPVVGLSLLTQVLAVVFFLLVAENLGGPSWSVWPGFFFAVPLGFMVTALPISPAGLGVGQAAFHFLFVLVLGRDSSLGATTITAFQAFSFLYGLIGAYFYITRAVPVPRPSEVEEAQGEGGLIL